MPNDQPEPAHLQPKTPEPDTPDARGWFHCQKISDVGTRCRRRVPPGVKYCVQHGGKHRQIAVAQGRYGGALKNSTLLEAYTQHLQDPEYRSLRDELAVLRAFTQAAMTTLDGTSFADLSPSAIATVTALISEIRQLLETTARIEQRVNVNLTITDLYGVADKMFDIITRYVQHPATIRRIASEIEGIQLGDGRRLLTAEPVAAGSEGEAEPGAGVADAEADAEVVEEGREASA